MGVMELGFGVSGSSRSGSLREKEGLLEGASSDQHSSAD